MTTSTLLFTVALSATIAFIPLRFVAVLITETHDELADKMARHDARKLGRVAAFFVYSACACLFVVIFGWPAYLIAMVCKWAVQG